jgi:hypothetical protein
MSCLKCNEQGYTIESTPFQTYCRCDACTVTDYRYDQVACSCEYGVSLHARLSRMEIAEAHRMNAFIDEHKRPFRNHAKLIEDWCNGIRTYEGRGVYA